MQYHFAQKAHIPLWITAFALLVNTVLNYGLIFGKLGLPAMGVKGAAIATLIARSVEVLIFVFIIYVKKSIVAVKLRDFVYDKLFFLQYIKTSFPTYSRLDSGILRNSSARQHPLLSTKQCGDLE